MLPTHLLSLYFSNVNDPKLTGRIHVLVVVPGGLKGTKDEMNVVLHEVVAENHANELNYYEKRGKLMQKRCRQHYDAILDKIEELERCGVHPLPFICVEGSSGMGKSQLAFALAGRRPYYYWLASQVHSDYQRIYQNFASISQAFHAVIVKDNLMQPSQSDVLNSRSLFYENGKLWTYGFIFALLKYALVQTEPKMIHFKEKTKLQIEDCTLATVRKLVEETKASGKLLPFFILDEMAVNENKDAGGMKMAAFQRNVFRVCGLLVIVMGTDSKMSNLVAQSTSSYTEPYHWLSLVPRFPKYQLEEPAEQDASWRDAANSFPILKTIAENSRGRFARHFIEKVAYCWRNNTVDLRDVMDEAFAHVFQCTQSGKTSFTSVDGKMGQRKAISGNNLEDAEIGTRPAKRLRQDVEAIRMHKHFANLVDKGLPDIQLVGTFLMQIVEKGKPIISDNGTIEYIADKSVHWEPKCRFPAIKDDMLLYLAILGGKDISTFHDYLKTQTFSTRYVFAVTEGFPVVESPNAESNNYKHYENMAAHAIFSSSRRNGVRGVSFYDFFPSLLGEFQGIKWEKVELSCRMSKLAPDLQNITIPFLAPVNTLWPDDIFDQNLSGCNFGNFTLAANSDRCDIYVKDPNGIQEDHSDIAKTEANKNYRPVFLAECKYLYQKPLGIRKLDDIIVGVDEKWDWNILIVFCPRFNENWMLNRMEVNCFTINLQGQVEFITPKRLVAARYVFVIETGF